MVASKGHHRPERRNHNDRSDRPHPYTRNRGARRRTPHARARPDDKKPQDACGVFGVWAPGEEVAKLTYFGLYALQHRGQEAAGIAVSDGSSLVVYKDLGLVSQVFDEPTLDTLQGHIAIGHTRYSTTGSTTWENAQPSFRTTAGRHRPRARPQRQPGQHRRARRARRARPGSRSATRRDHRLRTCHRAARRAARRQRSSRPRWRCCPGCAARSRWCSWTSTPSTPPATRRACARWCSAGSNAAGWSPRETAALDIVGASFVREIEPGELIADRRGRPALAALRQRRPEGLPVRVRLPRPPGHHDRRPLACTRPGSRSAAGWPASTRPRPTW